MIEKDWKKHINLGLEIAGYVVFFVFGGYFLDVYFKTSPYMLALGCLFSVFSVFYIIWKRYIKNG